RQAVYVVACFCFQAEDGIRDFHVTGVQTCALPISEAVLIQHMKLLHAGTFSGSRSGCSLRLGGGGTVSRSGSSTGLRNGSTSMMRSGLPISAIVLLLPH